MISSNDVPVHRRKYCIVLFQSCLFLLLLVHCRARQAADRHVLRVASDYPYYINVSVRDDLQMTIRLPAKKPGRYQIVIGANQDLPSEFAALLTISVNGEGHKNIPLTRTVKSGRVFLVFDFSVHKGDAYRDTYLDCHIGIQSQNYQILTPRQNAMFRQAILEFGFAGLE